MSGLARFELRISIEALESLLCFNEKEKINMVVMDPATNTLKLYGAIKPEDSEFDVPVSASDECTHAYSIGNILTKKDVESRFTAEHEEEPIRYLFEDRNEFIIKALAGKKPPEDLQGWIDAVLEQEQKYGESIGLYQPENNDK